MRRGDELIRNLSARKIEGFTVRSRDGARDLILGLIPPDATVGLGNSQTVKALGLAEALLARG
ncbi:MAG TPA: LUD domain-containing protein, partial [Firmicutes bacterium]|nr:LUD domain-containing protein [Bacillota bacterium]